MENVYCDSQSALHLLKNQGNRGRTKYIDVWFHYIREIVYEGNDYSEEATQTDYIRLVKLEIYLNYTFLKIFLSDNDLFQ